MGEVHWRRNAGHLAFINAAVSASALGQGESDLGSHVQLPIPVEGSPLDFLFAQEQVQGCGNSVRSLAKLSCEIALADDHVPGGVALVDIASIG